MFLQEIVSGRNGTRMSPVLVVSPLETSKQLQQSVSWYPWFVSAQTVPVVPRRLLRINFPLETEMKAAIKHALTVAGMALATQALGQVTFYEQEGFQGQSFTTQAQVRNFERFGFNDRASSVVVQSSRWEVCEDSRFEGRCVVLRPGRYPSLAAMGLNNRVSSVRAIGSDARIDDNRYAPVPVAAQVTFYEREGFQGRTFTTAKRIGNFERVGFNDRASSVDVVGDRWEVCEDAGFRGRCVVLRPGRYASLAAMGLDNRVSSVRDVSGNARIEDNRYAPAPVVAHDGGDYRRRNSERTYEANVTSVHAVVAAAGQHCWVEPAQAVQPQRSTNIPGAVVGAVLGGILGHQVGKGTTQDIATVGGAAAGGYVGSQIGGGTSPAQPQSVQRCENVPSQVPTYYDVSYNFRGQEHRVQMTTQPGPTVRVNEQGEPRT
jgi:uncharacterized protein YcfJ